MPNCPVCSSKEAELIEKFSVEESAAHICPSGRNKDRYDRLCKELTSLWPNGHCEVYQCFNCKFGFGVPFVGGSEAYYRILHEQMGYPSWRWDYNVALNKIKSIQGGNVLDIGAGSGIFLDSLPNSINKYGIESSDTTLRELEKKSIIGFKSIDELIPDKKENFDIITLFQVLEHISDFNAILKKISILLKQEASLIITVPDAFEMFEQERIIGYADMPPNHINKWTLESLKIALSKHSIEVVESGYEKKSIRNLLSKLHMKLLSDAGKKNTIASLIYKIQNKKIRALFLQAFAPFKLLIMLPHLNFLLKGGAFYVVAKTVKE